MNKTLLNLSGHPLSNPAKNEFEKNYDRIINSTSIHINFTEDIEEQVKYFLNTIDLKIDGSYPLTVIPPGQSTVAIIIMAYIHGLTGFFPKICYLGQNHDGVYIPLQEVNINIQDIRLFARGTR